MRETNTKFKLRPHYFWLCGLFVIGGLIASLVITSSEPSETYAYSAEDEWRTLDDIEFMQDMTAKICENSTIWTEENQKTYSLLDKRSEDSNGTLASDGRKYKTYSITRIKNKAGEKDNDGEYLAHCWMTQNLAIDLKTAWNAEIMTPVLTDVPDEDYFSGIGSATAKNTGFSTSNQQAIEYTNAWPTVAGGTYQSSYGYYYTWCAATAGCKKGSSAGASLTSGDADASICPAGWKLPSGNTNGDWYNLLKDLDMSTIATDPYNIPAAGYMISTGLSRAGSYGKYWSRSTASDDSSSADYLYFFSSNFYPGTATDTRYYGYSVRCVADINNPAVYPEIPADPSKPSLKDPHSGVFSIEVKDAITVAGVKFTDGSGNNVILSAMPGELVNGKIDVAIGSNVNYKINLSAEKPDLTSTAGDTYTIPAISQPLTAEQLKTNYGWGVMKKTNSTTDATVYTGLTATGETFYTSDTPAGASTETQFNVGVSVPPTLPADTYSTEVTITAIATQ